MNDHLVPLVGHTNAAKDLMDAHHPLPSGQCWIYGIRCSEHEEIFNRSPASIFNFRMSPGHYILNPHLPAVPSAKDLVLVDDSNVPDEGDPQFWISKFKAIQEKLGPAMPIEEYRKQEKEFEALMKEFNVEKFRALAENPRAAFRDEAAAIAAEFAKPGDWDPNPEALQKAESHFSRQEYAMALGELRSIKKTQHVLRVRGLLRAIDRIAWERLTLARGFATVYEQPDAAKEEYRFVIEHFPDTEAQKAARQELENLK
jgi:hypothetical protein